MKKITPVLIVESIEDCLPFWVERFGFTKTVEFPVGDRLGFVILNHGPVEVMLQSRASVAEDAPALAREAYRSALYIEVADLAPIVRAAQGLEIVVPERTTFYGAREIGVRDPASNVISFAYFAAQA